jgi:hypothetical protein
MMMPYPEQQLRRTPTMDTDFVTREFPSRITDLGFSARLARSWQSPALPEEEPAFGDLGEALLYGVRFEAEAADPRAAGAAPQREDSGG